MIYSVICMRKDEIMEILQDWNFWKKELDTGRYRPDYIDKCRNFLKTNVIIAIIGVRRSGKSYIMRQLMNKISENTEKKNILMINFEDRRFAEFYSKILDEIYDAYLEFLKPDKNVFVFLDEIHNVPKWEKWVRTMHELGKAKIIISGSSSKLLSGELSSVLTGRHLDVHVIPLSFKEFLQFKNIEVKDKLDTISKRLEIKRALNEYMEFGGFPEVVLEQNKDTKLKIIESYLYLTVYKDILERHRIKDSMLIKWLIKSVASNYTKEISINKMYNTLKSQGRKISKDELYTYASLLNDSLFALYLPKFSWSARKREPVNKVFLCDTGFVKMIEIGRDAGKKMENAFYLEMLRRKSPVIEHFFWKNVQHEEVDLIVKEGAKITHLIQISKELDNPELKEREIRPLLKASKELKCDELAIITEDYEAEEDAEWRGIKGKIKYVPLWKWLLMAEQQ